MNTFDRATETGVDDFRDNGSTNINTNEITYDANGNQRSGLNLVTVGHAEGNQLLRMIWL